MTGILYGVGVGPGDPGLLTISAIRCIELSSVIAYPCLEGTPSFARSIVSDYIKASQEEIAIAIPMLQEPEPAQQAYDHAAQTLLERLREGKNVAVLCEGDPFFYGSFQYLFFRLAKQCPIELVPGVSSLMSCSASLNQPLAARNDVLTILPAPLPDLTLKTCLQVADTASIIKIGRHFTRIRKLLKAMNLQQKSYYVERSTLPNEKIQILDDVDPEEVPYFSMILVKKRGEI